MQTPEIGGHQHTTNLLIRGLLSLLDIIHRILRSCLKSRSHSVIHSFDDQEVERLDCGFLIFMSFSLIFNATQKKLGIISQV